MSKFDQISVGRYFRSGGESYKKTSPQTFIDAIGIETYWNPLFDATIDGPIPALTTDKSMPSGPKQFVVDPQTRVVIPNRDYKNAKQAFGDLWGSALFECGPEDYQFMVEKCIEWGTKVTSVKTKAMKATVKGKRKPKKTS